MEKQLLQILLIEDNEDDYIVVKEMLSTLQKPAFEVSWAKTYEAAIATLTASTRQPHSADCPYDACLLDYRLGQHSGLELLQQAQLQDTQIPIILLTGIDDQAVDQQAMTIGAAGFLSKDEISPSNLERTIRYAIRQKQIQTTLKDTTAVLERQVEHLRQIQTRLLPSVSHEFRTPLMTIQSSANLLEIDLANEEKRESRFQLIYDGIDRIVHTLDNSLVYAALEAGGLPFNASPMALPSFCQGLVADLQAFADDQQQIQFMRQGNSPSQVSLDPNLVQLILTHLLLNAIRYAPKSGIISLILTYQAAMSGAIVTFHIQDRGIGIPSIEQDKIFDAYYRASNANSIPGTPGIGLGLAIVKSAASLHGGTVALTSEVGVGTSFTVSLPVRER